jgi:hypothetical protein
MKAIIHYRDGSADVLKLEDIALIGKYRFTGSLVKGCLPRETALGSVPGGGLDVLATHADLHVKVYVRIQPRT